jgi:hypothetical protein
VKLLQSSGGRGLAWYSCLTDHISRELRLHACKRGVSLQKAVVPGWQPLGQRVGLWNTRIHHEGVSEETLVSLKASLFGVHM